MGSECSIIINVSEVEFRHGNGVSGFTVIPPRPSDMPFSMLVIYPTPEIQDIGDNRSTVHWVKSRPLAKAICQLHTDQPYTKWGVALCEAEIDMPKSLEKAIEAEHLYLNDNPPQSTHRLQVINGSRMMVAVNTDDESVKNEKVRLSGVVLEERQKFEAHCRTLIDKSEIQGAKQRMLAEYARLVSEADQLWAGGPITQRDISDLHRRACRTLGQERPWSYTAVEQFPCPGCGKPCRVGVITCGSCGAIFEREIEEYALLTNREKAAELYPHRLAQEPTHSMNVETGKVHPKR